MQKPPSTEISKYFRKTGGTKMYGGINSGFALFESTDDSILKIMVVLSDGAASDRSQHSSVITAANDKDVKIYTVGLGSSTSYFNSYLKPLAEETSGVFIRHQMQASYHRYMMISGRK